MQRLNARTFESGMQVGIPVVPEIDHAEQRLQDRLILIVTAGRPNPHHRDVALEYHARRQGITRPRPRPDLRRARGVEPELLTADAPSNSRLTQDDGAVDPAPGRC